MNGVLTQDEFEMLVAAMEPPNALGKKTAASVFKEFADLTEGNVEFLSLGRLAALAAKYHVLTAKTQARFLGEELAHDFARETLLLREIYDGMEKVIRERLSKAGALDEAWEARLEESAKRVRGKDYSDRCTRTM